MPTAKTDVGRMPFSISEEYWHRREDPRQPANMQLELRVPGVLDVNRLREAVATACARHPMTRAQLVMSGRRRRNLVWELVDLAPGRIAEVVGEIEAADHADMRQLRAEFFSAHVDVRKAPALRSLVVHRPGGDTLLLSVNHTICDGAGVLRFLQSVTRAYTGRPDAVPAIDPIAARDLKYAGPKHQPSASTGPKRQRSISAKIRPLATEPDYPCYGFHHVVLTEQETQSLNPRRLVPDAVMNDLLLGAFLRAVDEWNGPRDSEKRDIVILMPLNLRPSLKVRATEIMANMTTTGRVRASTGQLRSERVTMSAVVEQTKWLKAEGIDAVLQTPDWVHTVAVLAMPVLKHWARPTGILTNLGRRTPPDFGPAGVVTEIWTSGGIGMPSGLLIGAATMSGRLFLTFSYRHALFDDYAAEQFAQLFLKQLFILGKGTDDSDT